MVELVHDYLYVECVKFFKSENFEFFKKRLDIVTPCFMRNDSNCSSLDSFNWG